MMARSTKGSNQRPDTLMQDRKSAVSIKVLLQRTTGPYIRVNRFTSTSRGVRAMSASPPIDGLIGLPACGQLKNLGAALQADGETRSALRPQASEGEAQHGLFCWTRPVGQGNEHLHCG